MFRYGLAQQLSSMFCTLEGVSGPVGLMRPVEQGGSVFVHHDRPPVSFNLARLCLRSAIPGLLSSSLGSRGAGLNAVQRVQLAHAKSLIRISD